jgi:hypothetical protein
MEEITGIERTDVVLTEMGEKHHAGRILGIAAAVTAAIVGSVFAVRRARHSAHPDVPITPA